MTVEQRSATMSRIRGRDTKPELLVAGLLDGLGLEWEGQVRRLPGRPDFVFEEARVAVFVDGDFWHGWRFPRWRHKLAPFWEAKIAGNRARDRRNHAKLRRRGWRVVRIWEHQLKSDPTACIRRVVDRLGATAADKPGLSIHAC
jgi:DNA mismatch endonuclease (patch repair protein)